jgi:hypothetical protein
MSGKSSIPYHDGMSSQQSRPKSTLAADRFRASQRPIGAPLDLRRDAPREATSMMGARSLFATGNPPRSAAPPARPPVASAPSRTRAAAGGAAVQAGRAAAVTATAAREQRDNVFVTSIVVAFVFLTLAIAGVKVSGSVQEDRSRTAISGTLTKAFEQQTAFRILNQRFATWPELEARGMLLPPKQRVVASNASRSHWFMSVRDTDTGIVCSRTGEIFDDSAADRSPSCLAAEP